MARPNAPAFRQSLPRYVSAPSRNITDRMDGKAQQTKQKKPAGVRGWRIRAALSAYSQKRSGGPKTTCTQQGSAVQLRDALLLAAQHTHTQRAMIGSFSPDLTLTKTIETQSRREHVNSTSTVFSTLRYERTPDKSRVAPEANLGV